MLIETTWKLLLSIGLACMIGGIVVFIFYWKKRMEEQRIREILSHQDEWGRDMCKWLIVKGIHSTDLRVAEIMQWLGLLGVETCRKLILRNISIGMTDKMILLSLGKPTRVDNVILSGQSEMFRWVYGVPRHQAAYVWFKDGKVSKIENIPSYTNVPTKPTRGDEVVNTRARQKEQELQLLSRQISRPPRATSLARVQRVKKMHFLRRGRV